MRGLLPLLPCLLLVATSAVADPATADDTLVLRLERRDARLAARVTLECGTAGVQGASFAVCSEGSDAAIVDAAAGSALVSGPGGRADFLSVTRRATPGAESVAITAVIDLEGSRSLPAGTHELLAVSYALQPGGDGRSIRICDGSSPATPIRTIRDGAAVEPRVVIGPGSGNSIRATARVEGALGAGAATVPIELTTDRPGLTEATIVLCHDPGALRFEALEIAPALAAFAPELGASGAPPFDRLVRVGCPDCAETVGFRASIRLRAPLPRLDGFPALVARYSVPRVPDLGSALRACRIGTDAAPGCEAEPGCGSGSDDLESAFRFGADRVLPATAAGDLVVAEVPRPTLRLGILASEDVDPLEVPVELEYPRLEDGAYRGFEVVVTFDPTILEVVPEATVEEHRGPLLERWIEAAGSPATERARAVEGAFIYSIDFGPCPRTPYFEESPGAFVRFRVRRKDIVVADGLAGPAIGGPLPLAFGTHVDLDGVARSTSYSVSPADRPGAPLPCAHEDGPLEPVLEDGAIRIGEDPGIELLASSAEVEVFEPAAIEVRLRAASGGLRGVSYEVEHAPSVALEAVRSAPALDALDPELSVVEVLPGSFRHVVVFDPSRPAGPVDGLVLAEAVYRPTGFAGDVATIAIGGPGGGLARAAVGSAAGPRVAIVAAATSGEVRLAADPNLLGYRAVGGRAPPGTGIVVSLGLDALAAGVPAFRGTLCHDPSVASIDPAYLGSSPAQLGPDLESARGGSPPAAHSVLPTHDGGAVAFDVAIDDRPDGFALPSRKWLEVLRIGYLLTGRYGDSMRLRFCSDDRNALLVGGEPIPLRRLLEGRVVLTDPLAAEISPEGSPADLAVVAVTEFGWRWGAEPGSAALVRRGADGADLGSPIPLGSAPIRIASGGEGWCWASLAGEVAIVRPDGIERHVPVEGSPRGIAVAADRTAWVAVGGKEGSLVQVARDGRILRRSALDLGGGGPLDVAIDGDGAMWVTHEGLDVVSRVAPDGTPVVPRAGALRSASPAGICADGRGRVWVADSGDRSLLALDASGREVLRVPLGDEPSGPSAAGDGAIWVHVRGESGGRLLRVDPSGEAPTVSDMGPSSAATGDRTGFDSVLRLLPEEDADLDGLANADEVRGGTDPLDAADPAVAARALPVRNLTARIVAVRPGAGSGEGGGAASGAPSSVAIAWENTEAFDRHVVTIDGVQVGEPLPGGATSLEVPEIPPGPWTVRVESFAGPEASGTADTRLQVGPGTAIDAFVLGDVDPVDVAADETGGRRFVLDALRREVVVLDSGFREASRFEVQGAIAQAPGALSGIAFLPGVEGEAGSLFVLNGVQGLYQELDPDGRAVKEPARVPFSDPGGFVLDDLASGVVGGRPRLFTIALGPQNDDILFFTPGEPGSEGRIEIPLPSGGSGLELVRAGIAFDPGLAEGQERLWVATGLRGDVLARVVVDVPLSGGAPGASILLGPFGAPGSSPHVRGIEAEPSTGRLLAVTSDRRLRVLSDFGVGRASASAPEIEAVLTVTEGGGTVRGGIGPVSGGTEVIVEGRGFGSRAGDLRVLFGDLPGIVKGVESANGLDRVRVASPAADGPRVVPLLLFRTRAFDLVDPGFSYCAGPGPGAGGDCDSNGVPDVCELPFSDCNGNGVLDACDISSGTSSDSNRDGIPDDCALGSPFRRGDSNGDGRNDLTDAVVVLGYLFLGRVDELGCLDAADTTADGRLNVSDPVFLLRHLFLGGERPAEPFLRCGRVEGGLGCGWHGACAD